MAKHSTFTSCWIHSSGSSRVWLVLVFVAALFQAADSRRKLWASTWYLYASEFVGSIRYLLQAGIGKTLSEYSVARNGIIHVRVTAGVVTLSGAVKSDTVKSRIQQIVQDTDVWLNGSPISPERNMCARTWRGIPLLAEVAEEGWLRHQDNAVKHPVHRRAGDRFGVIFKNALPKHSAEPITPCVPM